MSELLAYCTGHREHSVTLSLEMEEMHHRKNVPHRKLVTARPEVLGSIVLGILWGACSQSPCLIPVKPGVHSAILSAAQVAPHVETASVCVLGWTYSAEMQLLVIFAILDFQKGKKPKLELQYAPCFCLSLKSLGNTYIDDAIY